MLCAHDYPTVYAIALFACMGGACSGGLDESESVSGPTGAAVTPVLGAARAGGVEAPAPSLPDGRGATLVELDCRAGTETHAAAPSNSRALRRYSSDRYVTDVLFDEVSLMRVGDRLRVRWWMEDRGCPIATELVREGGLVILRETPDHNARCAPVGALLVETYIRLRSSDERVCVPGHPTPIPLGELERWSAPPRHPERRSAVVINPWAAPDDE